MLIALVALGYLLGSIPVAWLVCKGVTGEDIRCLGSGNVGVMKGVILGIAPQVRIVDISHQIGPQNIHQAAFVLARQIFYFPADTVHVVVVDPGVGRIRIPLKLVRVE